MTITPSASLLNAIAGAPAQAPAAIPRPSQQPSAAAKAAENALAARQSQFRAESQSFNVQTLSEGPKSIEALKAMANLPRGSLLNIIV